MSLPSVATPSPAPPHIPQAEYAWPQWALRARIAGMYVDPGDSDAELNQALDDLVSQNVDVVLADSPWGEEYAAWVDDARFLQTLDRMQVFVQLAHNHALKTVFYLSGLELISMPERNPGTEHPGWAQLSISGIPVLFNDISNEDEFWIEPGEWDFWLTPCDVPGASNSYSDFYLTRLQDIAGLGMDGLWVDQVYLQSSIGQHEDLWPSSDPCSVDAFQQSTGLTFPTAEDWDNPAFLHWVVWRHSQISDFLAALQEIVHTVDPAIAFFVENANTDTGSSTYLANDPLSLVGISGLSTAHEVETIGDRIDEGQTGMQDATLDEWLSFRTMLSFARGIDRQKPSWILTYGYQPADSARLAGLVLAEGANFYETQGPGMDGTVGSEFRQDLFAWINDHQDAVYSRQSLAQIGLVYSPRTRDLVDSTSGDPYAVGDSLHFASYRAVANLLFQNHVPFDVVADTSPYLFSRYHTLVLPEVQAMSDDVATALQNYRGNIIAIGDTGVYDEWYQERPFPALEDIPHIYLPLVDQQLLDYIGPPLVVTGAPPTTQLELYNADGRHAIFVVNLDSSPTGPFTIDLSIQANEILTGVYYEAFDGISSEIPYTVNQAHSQVTFELPGGLASFGLISVFYSMDSYLPLVTR